MDLRIIYAAYRFVEVGPEQQGHMRRDGGSNRVERVCGHAPAVYHGSPPNPPHDGSAAGRARNLAQRRLRGADELFDRHVADPWQL